MSAFTSRKSLKGHKENKQPVVLNNGNKSDKGLKNDSCNITTCQKSGAVYFDKFIRAYYCENCVHQINWPGGRADTMRLYGVPLLCELDNEV